MDELLRQLNLEGEETSLSLSTIEKEKSGMECCVVSLEAYDLEENAFVDLPTVFSTPILPVSPANIQRQEDIAGWPHLHDICLPQVDAQVGLLIGNDNARALKPIEIKQSRERASSVKELDCEIMPTERALGVRWSLESDTFGFKVKFKDKPPKRRGMLSIKFVAWILRFKANLHKASCRAFEVPVTQKGRQPIQPISKVEMRDAERSIIKCVQKEHFKEEIQSLEVPKNHEENTGSGPRPSSVKKSSRVFSLDPVLMDGVLRFEGRLRRASLPQDAKHHVILLKIIRDKLDSTTLSLHIWSLRKRIRSVPIARQVLGYSWKFSVAEAPGEVL
ncbi:hypothetical protein AWC38_SpisGene23034 [Stylophora pistillata]|uniref:Uncharacterized protein n=1 Tax=Stylophora pistillata TaxID=50429 RepID=A0A2B4R8V4_STYPI|nr:hypothetical protein AWC38_SpisGene23034 [Stylophora pistillata]